jgi:hypothetical protein
MDQKSVADTASTGLSDFKSSAEDHLDVLASSTLPVYGTRKSSRRLLQQLNQNQTEAQQLVSTCNVDCSTSVHVLSCNSLTSEPTDSIDPVNGGQSDITSSLSSNKVTNTLPHNAPSTSGSLANSNMSHSTSSIGSSSNVSAASTVSAAKHQRKWEMWQADDTRWFFEALNEHGKDFNAIHHYMSSKLKKKGTSEELMKNKEQIRCYFNRQWNKVAGLSIQNNNLLKGK